MRDRLVLPLVLAGALGTAPGGAAAQEVVEAEREETPAGKPSTGRLAVSAKYGSTGPAADLTYGWSRELHGRLTLSYEPHPDRGEKDTIRATVALLLDWHPGGRAFRLSGGLAYLHTESFDAPAGSRSSVPTRWSRTSESVGAIRWPPAAAGASSWISARSAEAARPTGPCPTARELPPPRRVKTVQAG